MADYRVIDETFYGIYIPDAATRLQPSAASTDTGCSIPILVDADDPDSVLALAKVYLAMLIVSLLDLSVSLKYLFYTRKGVLCKYGNVLVVSGL